MKKSWKPQVVVISGVTDCYQPAERKLKITRGLLEVFAEFRNPVGLITKNHLVTRDIDLLSDLARDNLARVSISITSLRNEIQHVMEPRTSIPARRLAAVSALAKAGVSVNVMVAPIIPGLSDQSMEASLEAAAEAGATMAGYTLMRLPNELKDLFREWLVAHYPLRADHVMSIVRQMRGGRENDPSFGTRMSGTGNYAELIEKRFDIACRRFGMNRRELPDLDCSRFRPPSAGGQLELL